ncbi:protein DDI1-like protein [Gossypium australe]|uniref:Protein DDI1-like protein n=1 Tax=Gossypium australe TaxID=47621 RepID=A0A5B6VVH5_9ROSI|nr:protein DDI1-like protein [Gossypium australe]
MTKNLNSKLEGVEDKMSCGLIFVDITMANRRLNALVDIGVSDLFMSKEIAPDLRIRIEKELGWIKNVNSKSVEIEGVAKGVKIQLGEWTGKETIKKLYGDIKLKPLMYGTNEKERRYGRKIIITIQFAKRVHRDEASYIATLKAEEVFKPIGEIPEEVSQLLRELPPKREVDHRIELVPNLEPPVRAPYRMSPSKLGEL